MGFSRQGYWSGLPFLPLEDLPNPGIKPRSLALQTDSYCLRHQGNLLVNAIKRKIVKRVKENRRRKKKERRDMLSLLCMDVIHFLPSWTESYSKWFKKAERVRVPRRPQSTGVL